MPEKRLSVEPPSVSVEDLEDYLATDDLFVEYFNYFLSLPTFPEPLAFNKERGGFEVVSEAKKEITSKIRTLIQQQKKSSPIYRAATAIANAKKTPVFDIHAFEKPTPETSEIKTSFTVQCLNKEQGIEWIKMERLPAFLQSDTYLEYRVAKLVSQAEIAKDGFEAISLHIDPDYRPFCIEKPVTPEPPQIDEEEIIRKDMFVCMGDTPTTTSEEWFSMAKMARRTQTTDSAGMRLSSAPFRTIPEQDSRPGSTVPSVATTLKPSTIDSGIWTPSPYEGPNLSEYGLPDFSQPLEEEIPPSKLFDDPPRMKTPPPGEWKAPTGDDVCVVADVAEQSTSGYSAPVFYDPSKPEGDRKEDGKIEEEREDEDEGRGSEADKEEEDEGRGSEGDKDEEIQTSPRSITVENVDELASVVVAMVVKEAVSATNEDETEKINNVIDRDILKETSFKCQDLNIQMLKDVTVNKLEQTETKKSDSNNQAERKKKISITSKSSSLSQDQEEDSLFGSDLEDDSDPYFSKQKTYSLSNKKGIDAFQKFLAGNAGEKNWFFWLDVDRARQIDDDDILTNYLGQMREKYIHAGGDCELSKEVVANLGLADNLHWTMENLIQAQYKMVEPLLLYWGPRFLMKQAFKFVPDTNYLYQRQRTLLKPLVTSAYPNPKTITLLPLRPKSCKPRIKVAVPAPPVVSQSLPATTGGDKQKTEQVKAAKSVTDEVKHVTISVLRPSSAGSRVAPEEYALTGIPTTTIPKLPPAPSVKIPSPPSRPKSGKKSAGSSRSASSSRNQSPTPSTKKSTHFHRPLQRIKSAHSDRSMYTESSYNSSSTRSSREGSVQSSSSSSIFLGGSRMESLLQGLFNEKKAGGFFMNFLEKNGKTIPINCLHCWHELQGYHNRFYAEVFSAYELDKKAQNIHSKYIVEGCRYPINVDPDVRRQIYREMDPPFEELFDSAEEHVLQTLVVPWSEMVGADKTEYRKIELIEEKRQLETSKSKHLKSLQRRGLIRERVATPEFVDEETKREAYYQSLEDKVPEEFKEFNFNTLIHNRIELEHFRQFLNDNYASMDLMCWLDIEAFRRIPHSDNERRDEKARDIKLKYLNKKYFFGPNSPAGKEGQNKVMQAGGGWGKILQDRPPTPVLIEVQKYVRERLERRWLPMFLCTEDFQERQHPQVKMDDVVDDVMLNKRKKAAQVWKMLESRWISSSRDIIAFRKALTNPVTCAHFRKFVSIRGENMENDILFWLEVQKYKELYHAHTEESIIHQKIQALIQCFIDSQIPPSLQIDIPQEQADKILEKRPREWGPYIFREAQLTVFRVLFAYWADFCNYRNSMDEAKMLEELEKKRRRYKLKERQRQRALEEKEAKEEARRLRREKGLEDDDDDSESQSGSVIRAVSPLAEFLQEEPEEQHIQWRYSNYVQALEKEESMMNAEERASSVISGSEIGSAASKLGSDENQDVNKGDENSENPDKKGKKPATQDAEGKGQKKVKTMEKGIIKSPNVSESVDSQAENQNQKSTKKKTSVTISGKVENVGDGKDDRTGSREEKTGSDVGKKQAKNGQPKPPPASAKSKK
ncbi:regulator of G-protein signaling 22-like isoform X2 [Ptychodera flava]|uniref:regulator of G-protein signaling 22-like isoform X2 n=1 Tax=Ptychodera flava TaxID=63121 RepID=UPI00396A0EAC